ncbi:MAG: branched-chain amino acid ABC transporter permease [Deltaproteobacteria bacterium]|jgi:branched-chain amino acid transport system permease protein|nr:branched-chain amino acid ABC transporter permease [Deltaproteobacteria bacterium]MBT4873759.1 branched-chain amino acid ABC transporter permease [Desulfobacula sp.]MBT4267542.1 branched-chain amino acid ABC transporter permease [Deltaproteobacteria bacterium]MBT4642760.1 branched-chain amino acid ABC transporter permease [Deltaproteobacteria bacterium]MBT6613692.1 branched-chain amino acid ABC transporter permease [Deltaproteobacteria bacterium]
MKIIIRLLKIIAVIIFLAGLIVLPHYLKFHYQDLLIFLTVNVLVVASYRIVTLTGEWSLIHAVMMGVGAYTAALLFKNFNLAIWFTLPLAGGMAGLIAALLSFPLFRMTQFYFLIGSFAAGEAIRLTWMQFIVPFGGSGGLSGIEPPMIGSIDFMDPIPYYYLALGVVSACLFILYRIEKSRIGLTLHAVHWKAPLAQSVGVDTWRYRALAFIIGSFFVGIAGALKIHYLGTITPNQFGIGFMVFILIWVIVGGYNTIFGPVIGVVVLTIFDESVRGFGELRPAIYGGVLIISILFLPLGLESIYTKFLTLCGIGGNSSDGPPP